MALYRVTLFGDLELRKNGEVIPIPGRNERRLLALLLLEPSRKWPRREVASLLWPEVDFEVSGNRLRTSLVALRKLCEVQSDSSYLTIDGGQIESDVDEARRLRRRVGFSTEPVEDARTLDSLLEILERGMLPEFDDEWADQARQEWSVKTLDALQKRAELAFQMENYEVASSVAERALLEHPADEMAWSVYLRAMAKRNLGGEAYRRFSAVKKHLSEDALDLNPQLVQLAKSVRDGGLAPVKELPKLDPEAQDLVLRAFRQMLLLNSRDAIRMVTTDSFRLQLARNPAAAVDLLESIIESTEGEDEDRIALHHMTLRAHYMLGNPEAVFELSDWLLARVVDDFPRRNTMMMRSYSHFILREYDEALRYIDEAIENCVKNGEEYQAQVARAERASFLWHCGRTDNAIDVYVETLEMIKDMPEEAVGFAPVALMLNIGDVLLRKSKYEEARPWLEKASSLAAIRNYSEWIGMIDQALGYVLIRLGRRDEGAQLMVNGLTRIFRSENGRTLEIGLDLAASALAFLGYGAEARGLIAWCTASRASRRHYFSVCEERFRDETLAMAGSSEADPNVAEARSARAVLEHVFAALNGD